MTDLSRSLAKHLGKFEKKGKSLDARYFENDEAIITSAVGHLVELKMPTGPNGKNLPWKFDVLPAIPGSFELQPIEKTEGRLRHVLKQARRKDVDLIVNACDAGREGELIFQYILDIGDIDKPVKRLWMQSMTTGAIQQAWDTLRNGEDMGDLADAAKCRSESDWLVGLNSTRALTCFRSRHGGFNITAAGRVQTPTLAILAKREAEIQAFNPTPYAEIHAEFGVNAGDYSGRWIDPAWKKDPANPLSRAERIWDKEEAERIRARCEGKTGAVTEEKKPTKQISPQLYDLTTLQREAPFTARNTLSFTQALYERHKMVTYPRTDSRYLPEDYLQDVIRTTEELAKSNLPVAKWAADSLENNRISLQKRVFNNAKVSDHFAIIPTGRVVSLAKEQEQHIYDMIVKRFVAVFFPHAEFEVTKRLTTINHGEDEDTFRTDGKILVTPGWLGVYGRAVGVASGKDELVPVDERGLGTPATRANIIEGLLRQKYLARDGRDLNVTGKGQRLIGLLDEMDIKPLTSPSMTGDWEAKLHQMEDGKLDRQTFMQEITTFTEEVVKKARAHYDEAVSRSFPPLQCTCPECGVTELKQTDATYECEELECKFRISKYIAGRQLSEDEAKELFSTKFLGPREGFISRFNKPFEAAIELVQAVSKTGKKGRFKTNFVFEQDEPEELSEDQIVASITYEETAHDLYETGKSYLVPSLKTKKEPDGVKFSRTILSAEIPREAAIRMLNGEKSELLKGFVSNRTKRKFDAFLNYDFEQGRPTFEFPPRKKAAKKKTAKKQ